MSLRVIVQPSELITASEAAEFMRIDNYESETTTINSFITAARQWCEEYLRRAIGEQTLEITLNKFPKCGLVLRPPVLSVTSVKYYDTSESEQTMDADDYRVADDIEPGLIVPESAWPDVANYPDGVKVRYVAGYCNAGDSPVTVIVPATIRTAMLMLISDMYENRTAQVEKILNANPTIERLLSTYRLEMGI